jgi:hypothetical protein
MARLVNCEKVCVQIRRRVVSPFTAEILPMPNISFVSLIKLYRLFFGEKYWPSVKQPGPDPDQMQSKSVSDLDPNCLTLGTH